MSYLFFTHLNLPGPPIVNWMIELHIFVYASALHSPWWSCPFLRQEEWKEETFFLFLFYPCWSLITPAFEDFLPQESEKNTENYSHSSGDACKEIMINNVNVQTISINVISRVVFYMIFWSLHHRPHAQSFENECCRGVAHLLIL